MWLWWIAASTVGFAVAGPLETVVGVSGGVVVIGYLGVAGIVAAALQWLVLRQRLPDAGLWIVAGVVAAGVVAVVGLGAGIAGGFAVGVLEGVEAGKKAGVDAGGVAAAILYGGVLGLVQWALVLRPLVGSGWWVPVSSVGWIVSGLMAGVTEGTAGWAVVGAGYGLITGAVLLGLLRRRATAASTEEW